MLQSEQRAVTVSVRAVEDTWHRLHSADGALLMDRLRVARSSRTRGKGLLGRTSLDEGEGLLLPLAGPAIPILSYLTKSIHMLFMRMSLDIVFVDRDLTVVKLVERVRPWRFAACSAARYVLEIAPGDIARLGLRVGDRLALEPPL